MARDQPRFSIWFILWIFLLLFLAGLTYLAAAHLDAMGGERAEFRLDYALFGGLVWALIGSLAAWLAWFLSNRHHTITNVVFIVTILACAGLQNALGFTMNYAVRKDRIIAENKGIEKMKEILAANSKALDRRLEEKNVDRYAAEREENVILVRNLQASLETATPHQRAFTNVLIAHYQRYFGARQEFERVTREMVSPNVFRPATLTDHESVLRRIAIVDRYIAEARKMMVVGQGNRAFVEAQLENEPSLTPELRQGFMTGLSKKILAFPVGQFYEIEAHVGESLRESLQVLAASDGSWKIGQTGDVEFETKVSMDAYNAAWEAMKKYAKEQEELKKKYR